MPFVCWFNRLFDGKKRRNKKGMSKSATFDYNSPRFVDFTSFEAFDFKDGADVIFGSVSSFYYIPLIRIN